jgi:hypothetical protein
MCRTVAITLAALYSAPVIRGGSRLEPRFQREVAMRVIAIVVAVLAVAACDDANNSRATSIAFSPTPELGAQFSPQVLPFALVTSSCAVGPVFTTGFNLLIVQTRPGNSFLDQVTFHLLDGTNLGGPSITFPRAELTSMFGSTLVVSSRAFAFRPQFVCGLGRPRSLVADVFLIDGNGSGRHVSVNAAFQ